MMAEELGVWVLGWLVNAIHQLMGWYLSPREGAFNSLYAATSPVIRAERSTYSGAYLNPVGAVAEPGSEAKDPVAAQDLWETSEREVLQM